ncbi:Alpha/Beta hydrolase protein [Cercophora scortea]|uniref:Carboxylic ester hydrolase n=1 Tax=Cercophora scortea TaxID=314031 RepID=A0AAE0J3G2_9PEZI|nr:Alpha/Beta hydrolase protein [Cercophora scortea]
MVTDVAPVVLFLLASWLPLGVCVDPTVNLTYSQYIGQPLINGVTQWLGIRYAAPPVGNLRFKPPQNPPRYSTPQDAKAHGKLCLATRDNPANPSTTEDCLFLDVYAPSNATSLSSLPVFFFLQGGGFNRNANPNLNGSGLIMASQNNMVVVTSNYRVGPYGFLTDGKDVVANNGLRDQRKALEWVQKYISRFGGDPNHVVLGGASAGAASISLHLTADGGKDRGLFHAVAAESVSFATILTVEESQYQYDNFAIRLGCAGNDSLACLRSKSAYELQSLNFNMPYPGSRSSPIFMFNPVLDKDFISDLTYSAFREGNFIKVPAIYGDDTNGGTVFAPSDTSTLGQSNQFIKNQFPFISLEQLGSLNELYPNPNQTSCPASGCWWRQLSNVYGEMRYMCPGLFISNALKRHGVDASYAYRWNVEDADQMKAGLGVPHTVELNALFGPFNIQGDVPSSYFPNATNGHAVPVIQGYWTSFIRSYDPNKYRCCGAAVWQPWDEHTRERLLFDTGGRTAMESIDDGLKERCQYLERIGESLHQ